MDVEIAFHIRPGQVNMAVITVTVIRCWLHVSTTLSRVACHSLHGEREKKEPLERTAEGWVPAARQG